MATASWFGLPLPLQNGKLTVQEQRASFPPRPPPLSVQTTVYEFELFQHAWYILSSVKQSKPNSSSAAAAPLTEQIKKNLSGTVKETVWHFGEGGVQSGGWCPFLNVSGSLAYALWIPCLDVIDGKHHKSSIKTAAAVTFVLLTFKGSWIQTLLLVVLMKWPWHLLSQIKAWSHKRLRRTMIETLESDLMQTLLGGGRWRGREEPKTSRQRERGGGGWAATLSRGAEVWRRLCWSNGRVWSGRRDARESGYLSAALTPSLLSISGLHLNTFSPVFHALHLYSSEAVEGRASFLKILPFVCALLTFDILLDLLAEWPRGFSFCKRKMKRAPVSKKKKTFREGKRILVCDPLYRTLYIMDGAVQCTWKGFNVCDANMLMLSI